jgi:integrase
MTDRYPGASPYRDRHGRLRWRYRRKGKTVALPGDPAANDAFEQAYLAAATGQPQPKVVRLPGAAHPRSLRACWRIVTTQTIEWQRLAPESKATQIRLAENFLSTVAEESAAERSEGPARESQHAGALAYGDLPIDQLKRRHIKRILARYADTPHAAADILTLLRKLTGVALDEEWIENDPTFRIKWRPPYKGWRAWTLEELRAFLQRWPIGTTPRLVFMLALTTGSRRKDIAKMKPADLDGEGIEVVQSKTGKRVWIPLHDLLREAMAAMNTYGETIVVTQYGRPFSHKALGMRMADWCKAAGIGPGTTLHGLRKTLGKLLAENEATTRQIMEILGHDDMEHTALYTREAEQKKLARDGMAKLDLTVIEGRTSAGR